MNLQEKFLAVDFGSTHLKAGLFDSDFSLLRSAAVDVALMQQEGGPVIDPAWAGESVFRLIREVLVDDDPATVAGVGIASMAETGLLLDRASGQFVTPLLPWFHRGAEGQVDYITRSAENFPDGLRWSGIAANFKNPLAKLLWLRDVQSVPLAGRTWLSAADFLLYLLTGEAATDFSLAGRTLGFDISARVWNEAWLADFRLPYGLFPRALQAGSIMGYLAEPAARLCGLPSGIPVTVAGHDHVCAALAAGVTRPGPLLDSMGTAEALVGAFSSRPLTEDDERIGLLYGCHVIPGMMYWMGSLSTSGGSVEWLRGILGGDPPITYEALNRLAEALPDEPGEIIFLPYLNGSGAPHADPLARGALIGLRAYHTRADIYKAVLEGTAYEMEHIRAAAGKELLGMEAERIIAIGGGTRNRRWMQIKADVSGQAIDLLASPEATLTGAAMLAGAASGAFPSAVEAARQFAQAQGEPVRILPNADRHRAYQNIYQNGYLPLQAGARAYSHFIAGLRQGKIT